METNLPPSQRLDPFAHGLYSGSSDLYSFFLGPPPRPGKDSAYSKKPTAKWNMPESYIGESEYLRDTVEDWNFTANQTWYTERILPWYKTDEIHVHWEQWENNPSFMEHVPHQAASHIVTQMRSIRKATLIRRGIGAEFEHDFVKTALGRTSFVASLAQIARSFQETANVEVIRALLGCHRSTQVYVRRFGIIKDGEVDAWLERKASRFMIAQKSDFGLEKMNTEIETEQEKYQGQANVWILGREVVNYCITADPNRTLYYLGGQEAVDRINGRPANGQASGGTMGNVRRLDPEAMIGVQGVPVYLAKSYVVDNLGELELLSRKVEVGVFNTMIDGARNHENYKTESRNIRVYDNDIDDWAEITIEEAIENCVVWATDGTVDNPFDGRRGGGNRFSDAMDNNKDFLRIRRPAGAPDGPSITDDIRYVGDLHGDFLKVNDALSAGQTVYNALKRTTPEALKTAETAVNAVGRIEDAPTQDVAGLEAAVTSLLGAENLFFQGTVDARQAATTSNRSGVSPVWNNLMGVYGAKKGDPADLTTVASSLSASDQEASHANYFTVLRGVVPEDRKDAFDAIVSKRDQPWKDRTQEIQGLLLQALREDPSSVPSLGTEARTKGWIKRFINEYEVKLQEAAQRAASSASAMGGGAAAVEVEYFPVGTPLPAGYEYLNAGEAARAQRRNLFPKSLSEFTGLAHFFVGDDLSMGGRRAGYQPIGGPMGETRKQGRGDQEKFPDPSNPGSNINAGNLRLSSRFNTLDEHVQAISASGAPLLIKWLALFYLGCEFSKKRLLQFAANHIYIPVGFLLLRPHATYETRYGIKCAAGGKSGYTFFGHSDMQIAHDAVRKVGVMHYTAYLAAVVTNPKNVYVVEDLFCKGYKGGMGVKFWSRNEYLAKGADRRKASIICTMLPASCKRLDKKLDIRGKFYTEFAMNLVDNHRHHTDVHYPGAARTALLMNWWDPVRGGKIVDKETRGRGIPMNTVCWQGVQWRKNAITGEFCDVIVEQGNFGPNVGPGSGKTRNGELQYNPIPSYLSSGSSGNRRN